jgi:hypothetical protein
MNLFHTSGIYLSNSQTPIFKEEILGRNEGILYLQILS